MSASAAVCASVLGLLPASELVKGEVRHGDVQAQVVGVGGDGGWGVAAAARVGVRVGVGEEGAVAPAEQGGIPGWAGRRVGPKIRREEI